ncbi:hypothetical protein MP228_003341 [Amoeboaphelidium protococcarum]|nr:hypothetical protein MP228_003341 [Amoeboaphelidium protococcarum]
MLRCVLRYSFLVIFLQIVRASDNYGSAQLEQTVLYGPSKQSVSGIADWIQSLVKTMVNYYDQRAINHTEREIKDNAYKAYLLKLSYGGQQSYIQRYGQIPTAQLQQRDEEISASSDQDRSASRHGQDVQLFKRQSSGNPLYTGTGDRNCSNVGTQTTVRERQYNCTGGELVSESDMETDTASRISCQYCNQPAPSAPAIPPYNATLAMNANCTQSCCVPLNSTVAKQGCDCPVDRMGSQCSQIRPFNCDIRMVSPQLPCSALNAPLELRKSLYVNESCVKYSLTESNITLSYQVQCKQVKPLNQSASSVNYQYWVRNGNEFALSIDPQMFLTLKVFNFYQLTDNRAVQRVKLRAADLVANSTSTLQFSVNVSALNALKDAHKQIDYLTGGRLYLEVSIASVLISDSDLVNRPVANTFLDFYDLPPFGSGAAGLSKEGLSGIVVAVIVFVIAVLVGVFFYVRHRRNTAAKKID